MVPEISAGPRGQAALLQPREPLGLFRVRPLAMHDRGQGRRLLGPVRPGEWRHQREFVPAEQGFDGGEHRSLPRMAAGRGEQSLRIRLGCGRRGCRNVITRHCGRVCSMP